MGYVAVAAALGFFFFFFFLVYFILSVYPKWKYPCTVPGPEPDFLFGNLKQMFAGGLRGVEAIISRWREKYGGVYAVWMGPFDLQVNVMEPEAAKAVLTSPQSMGKMVTYELTHPWLGLGLLTSDGALWHRKRRMLTPAFHFQVVKSYTPVMIEQAAVLMQKLKAAGGKPVDLSPFVTSITLDVIGLTAFGVAINAQSNQNSAYVDAVRDATVQVLERLSNPFYISRLYWILPAGRRHVKTLKVLHEFCDSVIETKRAQINERQEQGETVEPSSFVELLLLMRDEDTGAGLDSQEIRDEVNTFMFEGHDTTSHGIIWSLFLLAREIDTQAQIRREVLELLGDRAGSFPVSLNPDDVPRVAKLPLFYMFLRESQRLYPPVPFIGRKVEQDLVLPGPNAYKLVRGVNAGVDVYQLHHNPLVWDQPEEFRPDRFAKGGEAEQKSPFAFIPFSAGARNCIGKVLAVNEEIVVLVTILLNFSLKLGPGMPHNPQKEGRLILGPADPIMVAFSPLKK